MRLTRRRGSFANRERMDRLLDMMTLDLRRVVDEHRHAQAIREALARALFDARRFQEAADEFGAIVDVAPDEDYAQFGLGLSLWRLRRFPEAADHLAMAAVMRPDRAEYSAALRQVRATLAARADAGLDPVGDPDESIG